MKRGAWASPMTVISSFGCWLCTMPVSRHSCEDPFILTQEFEDEENSHLANEAITEALLMIYKRLNEEKDIDSLNLLMDRFEELLYSGHNSILNRV